MREMHAAAHAKMRVQLPGDVNLHFNLRCHLHKNLATKTPQKRSIWQRRQSSLPTLFTLPDSIHINKQPREQSVAQNVNSQRIKFQWYLWNITLFLAN